MPQDCLACVLGREKERVLLRRIHELELRLSPARRATVGGATPMRIDAAAASPSLRETAWCSPSVAALHATPGALEAEAAAPIAMMPLGVADAGTMTDGRAEEEARQERKRAAASAATAADVIMEQQRRRVTELTGEVARLSIVIGGLEADHRDAEAAQRHVRLAAAVDGDHHRLLASGSPTNKIAASPWATIDSPQPVVLRATAASLHSLKAVDALATALPSGDRRVTGTTFRNAALTGFDDA
jgi:hypothetical protein